MLWCAKYNSTPFGGFAGQTATNPFAIKRNTGRPELQVTSADKPRRRIEHSISQALRYKGKH